MCLGLSYFLRDKNNEAFVIFETVTAHEFIFMYKKSVKVLADNLCVKICKNPQDEVRVKYI